MAVISLSSPIEISVFQSFKTLPNICLHFGVQEGSALVENNYCKILNQFVKLLNGIKCHCYTDDTQIDMTLRPFDN